MPRYAKKTKAAYCIGIEFNGFLKIKRDIIEQNEKHQCSCYIYTYV